MDNSVEKLTRGNLCTFATDTRYKALPPVNRTIKILSSANLSVAEAWGEYRIPFQSATPTAREGILTTGHASTTKGNEETGS